MNYTTYKYHRSFKKTMREIDIINYLIDLDPELKATYELYHDIKHCMKHKNFELLKQTLSNVNNLISDYMKTSVNSLKKYIEYIKNSFKYDYTNGILEGINNKIKVIY
ncbi:transposase [Clostridium sp.]|uniref:transposase n=1 Tax=Clostridium sp. TaxID=1506 RepID=UPI0039F5F916